MAIEWVHQLADAGMEWGVGQIVWSAADISSAVKLPSGGGESGWRSASPKPPKSLKQEHRLQRSKS